MVVQVHPTPNVSAKIQYSTFVSETTKCIQEICQGADLGNAISIGESVCLAAVSSLFFYI